MSEPTIVEKKSTNKNLSSARKVKNDEFYTQYIDIEKEMNAYLDYDLDTFRDKILLLPCDDPEWSNFTRFFAQNFERFGIKKLISTSYARNSKEYKDTLQLSSLELNSPRFDKDKTNSKGKIYTLTSDKSGDGKVNIDDFDWDYLEDDGDFRSEEVKRLRDEADIIITNPPFSLFREFLTWIVETDKKFLIIGNINAITYREVFPLIKANKLWLGPTISSGDREFEVPEDIVDMERFTGEIRDGRFYQRVMGVRWFTNLDHGRRHKEIPLMSELDVIKFVTKKPFDKYDNYDAIDVSLVKNIPSDYRGYMGVPISFLDKYSPEQFEIIGSFNNGEHGTEIGAKRIEILTDGKKMMWNGPAVDKNPIYKRIIIKHKK